MISNFILDAHLYLIIVILKLAVSTMQIFIETYAFGVEHVYLLLVGLNMIIKRFQPYLVKTLIAQNLDHAILKVFKEIDRDTWEVNISDEAFDLFVLLVKFDRCVIEFT